MSTHAENSEVDDVSDHVSIWEAALSDDLQNFEDATEVKDDSKRTSSHSVRPPTSTTDEEQEKAQRRESTATSEPKIADLTATSSNVDENKNESSTPTLQSTDLSATTSSDPAEKSVPPKSAYRSRLQGFTNALPSVPWGPPPPPRKPSSDARAPSPEPLRPPQPSQSQGTSVFGRKVTAPFGWLNRATSTPKDVKSPPLPPRSHLDTRRNTTASVSTLGSNPDLLLKTVEESHDGPRRASLRDQFKMLRMREEAGITTLDGAEPAEGGAIAGLIGRSATLGVGIATPSSVSHDETFVQTPVMSPSSTMTDPLPINPNLPPGTVSGVAASAADTAIAIDWDFWQNVVNEGPQAVARTHPDDFSQAISGGIPQTIRPVIWQVLAGSKNEDLEAVYWELKSREPAKEAMPKSPLLNGNFNGSGKEKESTASSRSSIRSDHSTPATSANVGLASPSPSHEAADPLISARLQTQLAAERAKKAKEDSAALAKLEKGIKRDLGSRTSYSKYAVSSGLQDPLFHVLRAYALFDDAVGYPQGMNFMVMPLLIAMPEEEAFCLLVRLMNKYQVRDLFTQDMPGLHLHLYQFERLLEDLEPVLYCHLKRRDVTPNLYATQWFLTMFAYRFPLQLVMRVYDLVLCEGLEGAILKFGMAVIQKNVTTLLGMQDMQGLTNFLKEKIFDAYIDASPSSKSLLDAGFFGSSGGSETEIYRADLLVQDACAVRVTPEMLSRYREEWEATTKADKARETELENLKTDCATKASQIRSLEQRAEKSDAEHVAIANELVRLKVENNELHDQNESLSGHVAELKKVAESEAANVEERLKATTEQVMQRNIEVQNENRHMEEQMAEMERELVEMKMKYAEVSNQYPFHAISG